MLMWTVSAPQKARNCGIKSIAAAAVDAGHSNSHTIFARGTALASTAGAAPDVDAHRRERCSHSARLVGLRSVPGAKWLSSRSGAGAGATWAIAEARLAIAERAELGARSG